MINKMIAGAALYCGLVSIPGFAAGTLEVEESIMVNANPAAVWALAGNFNGLDRWHPAIAKSHQAEDVRTLTLQDGATITERLTNYNAQGQHYSYAITSDPLPVKDYQSTLRVESAKNHTSKVI
ncbi:SRPBCC family protein [Neptunomonas antarctica]|nr:SRPBCC family protein [Neptunomonas antarctica]